MCVVVGSTSPMIDDSPVVAGHRSVQYVSIVATTSSSLSLSCSADNQDIPLWDYYPQTSSESITVYNGAKPSEYLDPRFLLDVASCRENRCNLTITNVQLKDAGTFLCIQPGSTSGHLSLNLLGRYIGNRSYFNRDNTFDNTFCPIFSIK